MSYLNPNQEVRAGHRRWERAVNNYNKHRGDGGEKLFAARVAAANYAVGQVGTDGPYVFWSDVANHHGYWDYQKGVSVPPKTQPEWKRKDYACSTFCAALKVTLDCQSTVCEHDPEPKAYAYDRTAINHIYVVDFLQGEEFVGCYTKVTKGAPVAAKGAACRVCGRSIFTDGTVGDDAKVTWPSTEEVVVQKALTQMAVEDSEVFAVTADGQVIDIAAVKMIALTPRERALWLFTPADARAAFAADYGMTVAQYFG